MKSASAGLVTLLLTKTFVTCDLYDIVLIDGTVLRYTTGQLDVLFGGNVYTSKWLYIDDPGAKALAHWKTGLDVDTWVVHIVPAAKAPESGTAFPATLYGQPWLASAAAGSLSGALVAVSRAYWSAWPTVAYQITPQQVLSTVFLGRVASVEVVRQMAVVTINSVLEDLTRLMPRNTYIASCRHTLFDAGCTLSQASFQVAGCAVTGAAANSTFFDASVPSAIPGSGTCSLGQVFWTSGANAGLRTGIANHSPIGGGISRFQPMQPARFAIQVGDAFTAVAGCNKTFAQCGQFANTANFGTTGATIPSPETAV